jgi:hypothetical protein
VDGPAEIQDYPNQTAVLNLGDATKPVPIKGLVQLVNRNLRGSAPNKTLLGLQMLPMNVPSVHMAPEMARVWQEIQKTGKMVYGAMYNSSQLVKQQT